MGPPAIAPNGRRLAFTACQILNCELDVVALDEHLQPGPASRRLAAGIWPVGALAWTRDSESVLYTVAPSPEQFYLWRAWIDGARAPERVELAGLGARMPTFSASANRLVFVRTLNSIGVYTLEATPRPVLTNVFWDIQPQFSPDGSKLAFTSSRSGEGIDVWLAPPTAPRLTGSRTAQDE